MDLSALSVLAFHLFFSSKSIHENHFFWSFFDFLFLTSNEKKAFSFGVFLLQEKFETGFGFIAFGKEKYESRNLHQSLLL